MEYLITRLTDRPELKAQAAAWFHAKWGVPEQAYLDSMDDALRRAASVPQWYLAMEGPRIIGGMGVIENDFHDRKDLTPNVCAVYTESDFRRRGIAGALLQFVCRDTHEKGIDTLYLLTDHTGFYERFRPGVFSIALICFARMDLNAQIISEIVVGAGLCSALGQYGFVSARERSICR